MTHEHGGDQQFASIDMNEMRARQEMANHAAIHSVMDFIHGLNESQLESLAFLLHSLADPTGAGALSAHFEGMVKQVLHFKFKWCMCGERHGVVEDLLMSDMAPENADSPHPNGTGEEYSDPAPLRDPMAEAVRDVALNPGDIERAAYEKRQNLMTEYNVIERDGKLLCKLCGAPFISLRDRMLREPDDCSGCRSKAGQG